MTVQQQAYRLIDQLPDECVEAVISIMTNMLPKDKKKEDLGNSDTKKMAAFNEMQKLRKITAAYEITDYDAEREYAVSEKYGEFMTEKAVSPDELLQIVK